MSGKLSIWTELRTILAKREGFRAAFRGFDFRKVAPFDETDVVHLLADSTIVHHRGRIEAVINNARKACDLIDAEGALAPFIWRFEPSKDELVPPQSASTSPSSTSLSKELKKR